MTDVSAGGERFEAGESVRVFVGRANPHGVGYEGAMSELKRPGRPALHPEEQRQRLFAAAGQLLLRGDDADMSVRAIVKAAGMSSRSFYEVFDSKEALILELVGTASSAFMASLRAVIEDRSLEPRQIAEQLMDAYLQTLVPVVALDRKAFDHATRERVEAIRRVSLAELLDLVIPRLAEAHENGEIPDLPDRMGIEILLLGIEALTIRFGREDRLVELLGKREELTRLLLRQVGL
jgi:AcrR family transcriptional regulator